MFTFKSIVLIAAAFNVGAECSVQAAALIAPPQVGYAHAIPQNIAPYASQVNIESRSALIAPAVAAYPSPISAPYAAQYAAPFAAPLSAPIAARYASPAFAAPLGAAPYVAAPAVPAAYAASPVAPSPYAAASYALPAPFSAAYPYAAASPFFRAPIGVAPTFVR